MTGERLTNRARLVAVAVSTHSMEDKYILRLKDFGIDLSQNIHPVSKEFNKVKSINNPSFEKCYEHLILMLLLHLCILEKKVNKDDFKTILKNLKKTDISFWGVRFELYWYYMLLSNKSDSISNLRRGKPGTEADFVFNYQEDTYSVETTSLTFDDKSSKKNPVLKIRAKISEKAKKQYADLSCILVIDISNLYFYGILKSSVNSLINDVFNNLHTKFGAVLLSYSYHTNKDINPSFTNNVFSWLNKQGHKNTEMLLNKFLTLEQEQKNEKIYFKLN